jgi:hypothetical protein
MVRRQGNRRKRSAKKPKEEIGKETRGRDRRRNRRKRPAKKPKEETGG